MRRPNRTWIPAIALGFGAAATVYWLSDSRSGEFLRERSGTLILVLAMFVVLTTANLALRWLRWHFLARRFDAYVRTKDSWRVYCATLLAFATPFYVGELARGLLLARRYPRIRGVTLRVWLVERISDVAVLISFWIAVTRPIAVPLVAIPFVGVVWLLLSRGGDSSGFPAIRSVWSRFRSAWVVVGVSVAAWLLPVLGLWLGLHLLGSPTSPLTATVAFSRGTVLGGISGVPLGTGIAGSSSIVTLRDGGAPIEIATSAVLLLRAGTTWYAVALGVALLVVWRKKIRELLLPASAESHFDELAPDYADQLSAHFRNRVLVRKIELMCRHLGGIGLSSGAAGLDLGCGHGWYLREMSRRGYRMVGADASGGQVSQAAAHLRDTSDSAGLCVAQAHRLPFADESFDFVYGINLFHHILDPNERARALAEVRRVLKPQGVFFLQEMNVKNPLFRFYLSYLFPLFRDIDEGQEKWIRPTELPAVDGCAWIEDVDYFTFLPDFLPAPASRALESVEAWLERSRLKIYAAHFVARLQRV